MRTLWFILDLCVETFSVTQNTNANGGKPQDGIRTIKQCKERCSGHGLSSGKACYGFDFDRTKSQCYIFPVSTYKLGTVGMSSGVDHYRKTSFKCATALANIVAIIGKNT